MTFLNHRRGSVLFATLLLLASAVPALGHSELEESDPVAGGTIERTPYTLVARFGPDALDPARSRIVVRNSAGEVVAESGVTSDDAFTMTVELPGLPPGAYVARWTAVATDGHIVRGNIDFTIAQPPATPSPPPTASPAPATTGPGASPTAPPPTSSASPPATPSPSAGPTASPEPAPDPGQPAAADLLVGLIVAGLIVGGLVFFLLRRRP